MNRISMPTDTSLESTIAVSVQEMQNHKAHFTSLLNLQKHYHKKLKADIQQAEKDAVEVDEEWKIISSKSEDIIEGIASIVEHIQAELKKIARGLSAAALLTEGAGKQALLTYIQEDITLTVDSLREDKKVFDKLNDVIKDLRDMEI